jgi:hypothetical protein
MNDPLLIQKEIDANKELMLQNLGNIQVVTYLIEKIAKLEEKLEQLNKNK